MKIETRAYSGNALNKLSLRETSGNRDEMTDFFSNDKKTGGLKGHTILCFNP
jgi:hypothetical protein